MTNKVKNIYYSIGVFVFIVAAFFVVTYATGYKVDLTNRNISQMSMIVVQSDDADIKLNGLLVGSGKIVLRDLEPGEYTINISKEGYQDWNRTLELAPGQAGVVDDDILFKSDVTAEEYNVKESDFFTRLSDTEDLSVENNEIYQNLNFVTRLASDIKGVSWYADRRYIAYTADNQLKIIEIDGTNEITLLEKKSDTPVVFLNSGRSVVYESDGKVYKADIR